MRFHLVAMLLMASAAAPAAAQRSETPERRIERLEQQLRAVQRRVFPNGAEIAPEIDPRQPSAAQAGVPASSAVADLTARVDSLEAQLRELTGQVEQNGNRLRQVEEALARLRDTTAGRLDALERGSAPPAEPSRPSSSSAQPSRPAAGSDDEEPDSRPAAAATGDAAAEEAYNAGFRLWEAKRYTEAQKALEAAAKRYPKSKWASWANNLAGRAYLDAGKPATAAKAFLANYQANPKGERAADSLYFLGQALVALDKPADACKAYDELQDVYGATMRDWIKSRLPAARAQAKCR
ncbi:MAG TPA: outer membrane protein assembly factor BamD [Allosphingosinicella sp.]|jgi:TolA-binding protein|nr:outer membrane protein assembly factor BamD [Allosphingosinicella sp.]